MSVFKHKITGELSETPWNKEDAISMGYGKYKDANGCPDCGLSHPKCRSTATDKCIGCFWKASDAQWQAWLSGAPGRPEPFITSTDEAIAAGVTWKYEPLCENGAHIRKTDLRTKRCLHCAEEKRSLSAVHGDRRATESTIMAKANPDMIISRDDANLLGFTLYRTGEACRRGHKGWRYVSTGGCVDCRSR